MAGIIEWALHSLVNLVAGLGNLVTCCINRSWVCASG